MVANANEAEIEQYQRALLSIKKRTSHHLQDHVSENRTQFIKISQEAEKLKGEMHNLRGLLTDLTSSLGQTAGGNSSLMADNPLSKRKAANRSSVANLESMWTVQLQALWKAVEGSQKFLPAIPGRHIVLETSDWVELHAATWKAKRPVHIVLLNDHLLIATKKRKRADPATSNYGPVPSRLVAEECWPLQDVDMIDLASSINPRAGREEIVDGAMINAISIRAGSKAFTYRQESPSGATKHELLGAFRGTTENLRRTHQVETEDASKSTATLGYHNRRQSVYMPKMDPYLSDDAKPEIRIDVDGRQQNMRWVESQIDELDVDIALQRFEESISSIERLRRLFRGLKGNVTAQEMVNAKVDERAAKLAGVLLRALVDTHSFMMATKRNVTWLTRLEYEDQARETYLKARSDVMSKRIRYVSHRG